MSVRNLNPGPPNNALNDISNFPSYGTNENTTAIPFDNKTVNAGKAILDENERVN
jgi:hypothetical protein